MCWPLFFRFCKDLLALADKLSVNPALGGAAMVRINNVPALQPVVQSVAERPSAHSNVRQGVGDDVYIPSERSSSVSVDYSAKIAVEREWGPRFEALRDYVLGVLQKHGVDAQALAGSQADAVAAIADDGYWGVEQTADRIFEFVLAQVSDDPTRLEQVRAAINKGYEQAREAFGGWLPEISMRTIERVHERLNAWEKEISDTAIAFE